MKRYVNYAEQACYLNARDCIRFGYGMNYLNKCGLTKEAAEKIWDQAVEDLASEF